MTDLPPLRAVRAFEVCYRLRSYTQAAARLNVGQPAISHQIRMLEKDLGCQLFVKKGSSIRATAEADAFYETIAPALNAISAVSQRLRRSSEENNLTLATYPGLAAYWVLPRLNQLRQSSKALDVRVLTAERDEDLELSQVDCCVTFGLQGRPGWESLPLFKEEVLPMTSPQLARDLAGWSPERLISEGPLIHLEDPQHRWYDWQDWRDQMAPNAPAVARALSVTNHGVAIHQALLGAGVTLICRDLVADLLSAGALVNLPVPPLCSERGYWFSAPPGFLDQSPGQQIARALQASS
ncbi:LysR substrate-binding domain-containing protein [Rhodovibrionaceae bacterium A322]